MTQPKFTPGPWSLCHHLQSVESDNACPCGYRGVVYGPCEDARAICQPGHEPAPKGEEGTEPERYPRETEIANAHLIAAAPDLYEACEIALRIMRETGQTHDCDTHTEMGCMDTKDTGLSAPISDVLEHALAKARGEAT